MRICSEPFDQRLERVQRSIVGHWRPDGLQFMRISPHFVQAVHRLLLDVGCLRHSIHLDTFVNYHAVHSSLAPCECTGARLRHPLTWPPICPTITQSGPTAPRSMRLECPVVWQYFAAQKNSIDPLCCQLRSAWGFGDVNVRLTLCIFAFTMSMQRQ